MYHMREEAPGMVFAALTTAGLIFRELGAVRS